MTQVLQTNLVRLVVPRSSLVLVLPQRPEHLPLEMALVMPLRHLLLETLLLLELATSDLTERHHHREPTFA
jgi:hypothetical protein